MAFKGRSKPQVDFANLIVGLNKTGLNVNNQPLYQVIKDLIDKSQQSEAKFTTLFQSFVGDISIDDSDNLSAILNSISIINSIIANGTFWTKDDETLNLIASLQVLAGTGIALDYTVPGKVTVSSSGGSGGGNFVPMALGIEPIQFMSDGFGVPVLVPFIP